MVLLHLFSYSQNRQQIGTSSFEEVSGSTFLMALFTLVVTCVGLVFFRRDIFWAGSGGKRGGNEVIIFTA